MIYYFTTKPRLDDFDANNKRIAAEVLATFWKEHCLIHRIDEEENNVEVVSNFLVELAPYLYDALESSPSFVYEGEECWA
tara:strand:+ start:547 stop:786 length:240 start_codon:yes stop_codon:yes gene_type:complete